MYLCYAALKMAVSFLLPVSVFACRGQVFIQRSPSSNAIGKEEGIKYNLPILMQLHY